MKPISCFLFAGPATSKSRVRERGLPCISEEYDRVGTVPGGSGCAPGGRTGQRMGLSMGGGGLVWRTILFLSLTAGYTALAALAYIG